MSNLNHLTRQMDIIDHTKLGMPVTIVGCGGIGSFTALTLAKMGMTNMTCFDFDSVSIENMNNQFFRMKDIDKPKSQALQELIKDFTNHDITTQNKKFTAKEIGGLQGILIFAVDSMLMRSELYDALKSVPNACRLLIDTRMGAETYMQYTLNPKDEKQRAAYEKTLYKSSEVEQVRCTEKSTIYTATLAAGIVTKTIKNVLMNQPFPRSLEWSIAKSDNNPSSMSLVSYAGNV